MFEPNQPLTLRLHFDADQTDSRLAVRLPSCARPVTGKHAGVVLLPAHSHLPVVLVGSGLLVNPNGRPFETYQVHDFCIVTHPKILSYGPDHPVPEFADPSPFQHHRDRASQRISWEGEQSSHDTDKYRIVADTLNEPLHLGKRGCWSATIVVTVQIRRFETDEPEWRVFHADFDAELAESSNGSIE